MRWLLVPWKVKEEPFWRHYFGHIFVVKSVLLDGHGDDAAALALAGAPVHEGRRHAGPRSGAAASRPPPPKLPPTMAPSTVQLDAALASLDDDISVAGTAGFDSVVELSSIDALSLEEQINAALADD